MLHSQRSNRLLPAKLAAGQTYLHPDSIPYLHASTAARGAGGQHGHKYGLHNTRYRLERWVTPEGVRMLGRLSPRSVVCISAVGSQAPPLSPAPRSDIRDAGAAHCPERRGAGLAPQQALDPDDEVVAEAGVGRIALERVEGLNDLAQVFRRAAVFEAEEGLDGGADGGLGMPHEAGFVDQVIGQPRPKGFEPTRGRGEEVGDLDGGAPGRMAVVENHRQDGRQLALGEFSR